MSTRVARLGPTIESRDELRLSRSGLEAERRMASAPSTRSSASTGAAKRGPLRRRARHQALLEGLKDRFGWDVVLERGKIALRRLNCPKGGIISLEPGGQLELSGAPLACYGSEEKLRQHLIEVREVGDELGIGFRGSSRRNGLSPRRRSCPRRATPSCSAICRRGAGSAST